MTTRTRNVLKWVNRQREKLNLPPLEDLEKGRRTKAMQCPIINSVLAGTEDKYTGSVFSQLIVIGKDIEISIDTPLYVREWIWDFDAETKYQEYAR